MQDLSWSVVTTFLSLMKSIVTLGFFEVTLILGAVNTNCQDTPYNIRKAYKNVSAV